MARKTTKRVKAARRRRAALARARRRGRAKVAAAAQARRGRSRVELAYRRMFGGQLHGGLSMLPGRRRGKHLNPEDVDRPAKTGAEKRRARGIRGGPAWCAKGCGTMRRRRGALRCPACGGTVPEPIQ